MSRTGAVNRSRKELPARLLRFTASLAGRGGEKCEAANSVNVPSVTPPIPSGPSIFTSAPLSVPTARSFTMAIQDANAKPSGSSVVAFAPTGSFPLSPVRGSLASYFLSKIELRRGKTPTMAPWRKRLFIATSYITANAAEYFSLPRDQTVIMGSHIEV
ncbi:KUP/HAK/KT family potassium transporter [Streptomyces sp.]|uniref:KUP/HAK/KT family potassium transporter n=1 Tax=Streptomyces sp. TaxID=1931 RepID=UPI002D7774BF|nr:hypothetical protein [Streptomyces sp.]HET6354260.1 hypothetical protein [Streptomyces sp.]